MTKQLCGAKTRSGKPCKLPAMANGRCRLHGGLSTGPKTPEGKAAQRASVTKHGIYAKALTPEEQDLWSAIPLGELDDEIRMAKLRLRRALLASDKDDLVAAYMRRIERLEIARSLLLDRAPGGTEGPDDTARAILLSVQMMDASIGGDADEDDETEIELEGEGEDSDVDAPLDPA